MRKKLGVIQTILMLVGLLSMQIGTPGRVAAQDLQDDDTTGQIFVYLPFMANTNANADTADTSEMMDTADTSTPANNELAPITEEAVQYVESSVESDPPSVWNHNPASTLGPNLWGSLTFPFATCGAGNPAFIEVGKKQSPVNIVTAATVKADLPELAFRYDATPFIVENTGHVVEVPYAPGSSIRVGQDKQDKYELLQLHFHAPSEHMVNGQFAAAELHLVHRNNLLDLAVVGVLINVGSPVNRVIDNILRNAPIEEGEIDLPGSVKAKDVLPQSKGYYNYSGSLTTPPCSEGVRWFVLKKSVFVSQEAIDHLHEIISEFPDYGGFPDNNRPVRPLNGRAILHCNCN